MARRKLLWVDDHALTLRAYARSVRLDFAFVSGASVGEATQVLAGQAEPPECAVVDFCLPDGDARDVVRALWERFPGVPVAITTGKDLPEVERLLVGVRVEVIAKGHRPRLDRFLQRAPLTLLRALPSVAHAIDTIAVAHGLRPREVRILSFLASGSTRATLAEDMQVNPDTLKSQLATLFQRMSLHSTVEILAHVLALAARSDRSPGAGECASLPATSVDAFRE
jgi:DNA-binding NarL/FixJ family response regulator